MINDQDRAYMRHAIELMRETGILNKTGGPFGAVIVRNGEIIGVGGNSVVTDNDPTAHAEINAIRAACQHVGSFNLTGAILYTSCECCPMCYAAAYWARIFKIYYAASWQDYADLFDDSKINADMTEPYQKRLLKPEQLLRSESLLVWNEFRSLPDGARY